MPTLGGAGILQRGILGGIRTIAPAYLTGLAVSSTFDKASKKLTGKTTEELVSPYIGNELSFLSNPGTYVGGKIGYNFHNLGRFTIDNVYPSSYKGHLLDFTKTFGKAINPFSRVPTFNNGRRPKWYKNNTISDKEFRLENAAEWAGIPEKEIPRIVTVSNGDGTRGFRKTTGNDILMPEASDIPERRNYVTYPDYLFGVGGEHSKFTLKEKIPKKGELWLYEDNLKLNPLYMLTDKIKDLFKLKYLDGSYKSNKILDPIANIDLKWLIGFDKNIKYKQFLYKDENGKIFPLKYETVPKKYKEVSKKHK